MKFFLILILFFTTNICLAKRVMIDKKQSTIEWTGQKKFVEDNHKGTIKILSGSVNIDEKDNLSGGSIVLDMKSIETKDLSGKWKTKLDDHLRSDDFFDVKNNPEAIYKITKVEPLANGQYRITGNLTLRQKTNVESFDLNIKKAGNIMTATGDIQINRIKYGVSFNPESSLLKKAVSVPKDKIIKDNIQLKLNLVTQPF